MRTTTDQLVAVVAELSKLDQRGKEFILGWLTKEIEKVRAKKQHKKEGMDSHEQHLDTR